MKISYMQTSGSYGDGTPMLEELNELGAYGWDVVSLKIDPMANNYRAVMKRETPKERAHALGAEIDAAIVATKPKKGTNK